MHIKSRPYTVAFTAGFVHVCTPYILCPMMRPFRIRTAYVAETDTLIVSRDQLWSGVDGRDEPVDADEAEFHPASDGKVQSQFLKHLTERLENYYQQLSICCVRRGTNTYDADIGMYPVESK